MKPRDFVAMMQEPRAIKWEWDPEVGMKLHTFDGATYDDARDGGRLNRQHDIIYALMRDGRPRTLAEIEAATGFPQASISARLRDFRKPRFGGHDLIGACRERGVWVYRLVLAEVGTQQRMF